jgi:hypothetical protein
VRRWDRKQVGFFLLLGWVVLISVIAISAVARSEDRSGDERAALSLLNSLPAWEETWDGPEAVSARDRAHLKRSAALIPNELRTAHLIFLRGLDPRDIETLIGSQSPAVHAVLLGGPVPDPDHFVEGSGGRPNFL